MLYNVCSLWGACPIKASLHQDLHPHSAAAGAERPRERPSGCECPACTPSMAVESKDSTLQSESEQQELADEELPPSSMPSALLAFASFEPSVFAVLRAARISIISLCTSWANMVLQTALRCPLREAVRTAAPATASSSALSLPCLSNAVVRPWLTSSHVACPLTYEIRTVPAALISNCSSKSRQRSLLANVPRRVVQPLARHWKR